MNVSSNECFFHQINSNIKLTESFVKYWLGTKCLQMTFCRWPFGCLDLRVPFLPHAIFLMGWFWNMTHHYRKSWHFRLGIYGTPIFLIRRLDIGKYVMVKYSNCRASINQTSKSTFRSQCEFWVVKMPFWLAKIVVHECWKVLVR